MLGTVSGLDIALDIVAYGMPPGDYTVSVDGAPANVTVVYPQALYAAIQYAAPQDNLSAKNNNEVQSLDMTVTVPVSPTFLLGLLGAYLLGRY